MFKNVLQMIESSCDRVPHKVAFSDENGAVTYQEAVAAAKAIGSSLSDAPNARRAVAVMIEKSKETLISFMGVIYSGNFYIPIDVEMPDDRIEKIFSTVEPLAVICDDAHYEKACGLSARQRVIRYSDAVKTPVNQEMLSAVRYQTIDTDPVYALFTSGSTGVPKGVVCCHRSVIDYAEWLVDTFAFDESTVFGSQTPFYFSMSVMDVFSTFLSGAELHIIPKKLFAFPIKLLEHMNEVKINTIYWVPTALSIVANMKALDKISLPYLKKIFFAGEPMPNKQLNIWRSHLPDAQYVNLFGPTEITDIGIYYVVDRPFADDDPLPIGKKCDNVDALVLDENGRPTPYGEIGELCIRGSFLALGYYNNPEKTAEVFVQNPLNSSYPELIYKTGDLVSYNPYGELMYHGRKDFQIKHRGNRIELGEIENAANGVPGIHMCACTYDTEKEKIVLFYEGAGVTTQSIRESMSEKVPAYMLPNVMLELESLPKNQNGKIDRGALKTYYKEKKSQKK